MGNWSGKLGWEAGLDLILFLLSTNLKINTKQAHTGLVSDLWSGLSPRQAEEKHSRAESAADYS